MKRVLVRSVYDAFDYVMDHYYPVGMEDMAKRKDLYAVISIQDSHMGGFGFTFTENEICAAVLTLLFDDIEHEVEGAVLFSPEMARSIIDFVRENNFADTLLIHCYGGESRSRAVGAFVTEMLHGDSSRYFSTGHPNRYVYQLLKDTLAVEEEA